MRIRITWYTPATADEAFGSPRFAGDQSHRESAGWAALAAIFVSEDWPSLFVTSFWSHLEANGRTMGLNYPMQEMPPSLGSIQSPNDKCCRVVIHCRQD
jgi:hypothetical protein